MTEIVALARRKKWPFSSRSSVAQLLLAFGLLSSGSVLAHGGGPVPSASRLAKACLSAALDAITRRAEDVLIAPHMQDLSGTALRLEEVGNGARAIQLSLGRRYGAGYFGSVYRIESHVGDIQVPAGFDGALAAKFPHSERYLGTTLQYASRENASEYRNYRMILGRVPDIEASAHYPRNPPWPRGGIPVIPIFDRITTARETILIKPAIENALSLKQLARKYGSLDERGRFIFNPPARLRESLREIHAFVQAVADAVPSQKKLFSPLFGAGYHADIRQPNLMWIEDPEMLRRLGYDPGRPTFILAELSQVPANYPMYRADITSADQYEEGLLDYLEREIGK